MSELKWIVASLMLFRFLFGWHSFCITALSHGLFLLPPREKYTLAVQHLCTQFWIFWSRYSHLTIHKVTKFYNSAVFKFYLAKKWGRGGEHAPLVPPGLPPVSATFRKDIHVTFYLLTWTYFNDVNGSRNILTNSQLKRILFMSSKKKKKKKWNKTEKEKKIMEKNNSNESETSVKMGYQI